MNIVPLSKSSRQRSHKEWFIVSIEIIWVTVIMGLKADKWGL